MLDNFNESYHVPTVHMGATPSTDRTAIAGGINTYFKETQFDLANEGHARMIMKGGYGAGVTDTDGNIVEPLASLLGYCRGHPRGAAAGKASAGPRQGLQPLRGRARRAAY